MGKERILLVTGKFPGVSLDIDGGSIMVSQLIEMFGRDYVLDILFTRTYNEKYKTIPNVNNVTFHPCKFRNDNKFVRRVLNTAWNKEIVAQLIDKYDKVIIIHVCKSFGLEELQDSQLEKIVLFSMFLTSSYIKSGEYVPKEYIQLERNVLPKIKLIVTPTYIEKDDLVNNYGICANRITVVPRAVNKMIVNKARSHSMQNSILYIGSIKRQKNSEKAIELVFRLKEIGLDVKLYMVGSVQDKELFDRCKNMISVYNLQSNVFILGVMPQEELVKLMGKMDINISVSSMETFGRGVIEGLAAGLPTIILNELDCLKFLLPVESGLICAGDMLEMTDIVHRLCIDSSFYRLQSENTRCISGVFSLERQKQCLLELL